MRGHAKSFQTKSRPIRFALKSINAKASEAIYAGDDKRDIDAANGADVFSVAVQWGYLGSPQPVQDWCADLIVHNPSENFRDRAHKVVILLPVSRVFLFD